jgi:hypothetical protein
LDLAQWVDANAERLAERWLAEVAARSGPWPDEIRDLVSRFMGLFVSLLPVSVGPLRAQFEPLWLEAAELYGSVSAMRGLAAGEVIEEFQSLREALIRALYERPPKDGHEPLSLREILTLNRIVDQGVTQASVGHTDALFFALFQGSGLPASPTAQLLAEVREQIDGVASERDAILADVRRH